MITVDDRVEESPGSDEAAGSDEAVGSDESVDPDKVVGSLEPSGLCTSGTEHSRIHAILLFTVCAIRIDFARIQR